MAEPPPKDLPTSPTKTDDGQMSMGSALQKKDLARRKVLNLQKLKQSVKNNDSYLHSLSEVEELKKVFLEWQAAASEVDTDTEYQKEMEEDRIADRKNGHFVENLDTTVLFKSRCRRKNSLKLSAEQQLHATADVSRSVARVSSRVAAYESHISARISEEMNLDEKVDEGGKREMEIAGTHNANFCSDISSHLQPNQRPHPFVLDITENEGETAAQIGERVLTYSFKPATDSVVLEGCDIYGNNINYRPPVNNECPNLAVEHLMEPMNHAKVNLGYSNVSVLGGGDNSGALISDIHSNMDLDESGEGILDKRLISLEEANSKRQEVQSINDSCLENAENEGLLAVQSGKEDLNHPKKAFTNIEEMGGGDNLGTNNINGEGAVNMECPNMGMNHLLAEANHATSQPFAEVNSVHLNGNLSISVLGSGDKSGTLIADEMVCMQIDSSQRKLTEYLNEVPSGHGMYTSSMHALDVCPISALSAAEAADMDLLEVQPLLQRQSHPFPAIGPPTTQLFTIGTENILQPLPPARPFSQPLLQRQAHISSAFGPPTTGPTALGRENSLQPNPPTHQTSQVSISSAFIPYKPNHHLHQINTKPTLPPLSNTHRPNSHSIQPFNPNPPLSVKANHTATHNSQLMQQISQINQRQSNSNPNLSSIPNTSRSNKIPLQPCNSSRPTSAQKSQINKTSQRNINNQKSLSITNDITLALFGNHMHEPSNPTPAQVFPLENCQPHHLESSAFPPLRNVAKELHANGVDEEMIGGEEATANVEGQPMHELRKSETSKSWAYMAGEARFDDVGGKNIECGNNSNKGSNGEEQPPKIVFGRSMADTLRSGQSADGPIILDHERFDKRGEVRFIEGKPCLFFSADESSDLAGRLGPAIVGKFSHSIPTAHQIQKALGNLKLVGSMSWNFLNAKHVFIQLSEMSDYAKILNGPNNSPVWYIEHHPMRVFKWTPDFDPFFEIPIVALWCNILALPVHLFEESALIAIGNLLGHAVQVDRATISRSRVSFARICVEVDISQPIPEEISLDIAGKRVTLKVKWDKIPLYCSECRHVGHNADNCYAFGRRPMPPKRDYSRGVPSKSGPSVQRRGDQPPPRQKRNDHSRENDQVRGHEGQPRGGHAAGDHRIVFPHAQSPGGQPHGRQILETQQRERHQGRGPAVHILHEGSTLLETALKAKGHLSDAGPSGTAMEETQEAEHDGFLMPKKKKKNRSAANRARKNVRRRQRKEHNSTSAEVESEGGGDHRSDGHDSALESDRGNGSLSPSYRPRHVDGPLAMVAVNNNMFGALEDFPSDDDEGTLAPDILDTRMIEAFDSRTRLLELEDHGTGHTSPPSEGRLKKARLGASGAF
ncbi:hypothetical protein AAHA92_21962 [Salvia divinorum]|uniref:DUF4283 domain-containing protein n=2 Tax=Salvia divinorum TaxID=28513 RepID=A0ABD1GQ20_SALDI